MSATPRNQPQTSCSFDHPPEWPCVICKPGPVTAVSADRGTRGAVDRDTLITAIAAAAEIDDPTIERRLVVGDVLDAISAAGYRVIGPAESVDTEYAREFDDHPEEGVLPWNERFHGVPCPEVGTVNGHPVHRVKREVSYTAWRDDRGVSGE